MKDNNTTLIWSLYVAGLAALLTPFIGVGIAYGKRRKADAAARAVYDRQIAVFWRCGLIWLIAFGLMILALITDTRPVGSGTPLLFSIGVLLGIAGQLWFYGRSAVGLVQSFRTPRGPALPA